MNEQGMFQAITKMSNGTRMPPVGPCLNLLSITMLSKSSEVFPVRNGDQDELNITHNIKVKI